MLTSRDSASRAAMAAAGPAAAWAPGARCMSTPTPGSLLKTAPSTAMARLAAMAAPDFPLPQLSLAPAAAAAFLEMAATVAKPEVAAAVRAGMAARPDARLMLTEAEVAARSPTAETPMQMAAAVGNFAVEEAGRCLGHRTPLSLPARAAEEGEEETRSAMGVSAAAAAPAASFFSWARRTAEMAASAEAAGPQAASYLAAIQAEAGISAAAPTIMLAAGAARWGAPSSTMQGRFSSATALSQIPT